LKLIFEAAGAGAGAGAICSRKVRNIEDKLQKQVLPVTEFSHLHAFHSANGCGTFEHT
jgi:hypothetical protein